MEIIREVGEKGQVVIPVDIRRMLKLKSGSRVVFEVKDNEVKLKQEQSAEKWLKDYLKYRKKGKEISLEELKKIQDESYDLH
jgi:AbrB family looped-hinge helix DNA binding protein